FMPVIVAKQLLHRDGAAESLVDRANDAAQTAASLLCNLLVSFGIVDRELGLIVRRFDLLARCGRRRRGVAWRERRGPICGICRHTRSRPKTRPDLHRFPCRPSGGHCRVRAVRILYFSLAALAACGPSSDRDGDHLDASSPDARELHDAAPPVDTSRVY